MGWGYTILVDIADYGGLAQIYWGSGKKREIMNWKGRVAFVTGGGRGIGAACSVALAEAGADVALTYRRDEASANEVAGKITALGRKAIVAQCDVSEQEQVAATIGNVIAETGKIDILVCSAGIASRGNSVRDTTTEEMRRVLDTHVMGSFWCCQGVIDSMRAQGSGHIIIISSVATIGHAANGAPYNMAKSALESLTKTLMQEEGPNGIRVNAIGPGLVETEMGRRLSKARGADDIKDLYKTYPFDRVCQPEDIANLAAYLCSDAGSYISGQVIYVDGGGFVRPTG